MAGTFSERYGPWALVAGAAEGLGAEFTRCVAKRGLNVLLADRDRAGAAERAREIAAASGVETAAVDVDLGADDAWERLYEAMAGREVGLLIYNAGLSHVGPFLEQPLEAKLEQLDVNCRGPLRLVHELAPGMAARGRGGIVLLSSMAGLSGHALVASYGATKAYNLVLAEALWEELRSFGVDVLAVCPGPTRTPGYESSGSRLPLAFVADPAAVAEEALDALGRGPVVVTGAGNRIVAQLLRRALPHSLAAAAMGRLMRTIYPRAG
jgi:hypothetical protein